MNDRFTKVYESILDSSIWFEDSDTRCVWLTLLALAEMDGTVSNTVPGLARRAFPKPPLQEAIKLTESALALFMAPDEYSRTKDDDGRRVREIEGGWFIINHGKYRERRKAEERREQNRAAQQRKRDRQPASARVSRVSTRQQKSAQVEAEEDVEAESPLPPEADGMSLRDVARVFREALHREFPSDIDTEWTMDDRDACRRMRTYCDGDGDKLRAQLLAMKASDAWLPKRPIKDWAKAIDGTFTATGAAMAPERYRNEGSLTE